MLLIINMNHKPFVFKMLRKSIVNESAEKNITEKEDNLPAEPTTNGFDAEQSAKVNDASSDDNIENNTDGGFGGAAPDDINVDSGENSNTKDETDNNGDDVQETEDDSKSNEDQPKEEEKKSPSDSTLEEFEKLVEQTEDSYDLLKFFKSKFNELEPEEFNKFLSKLIKNKELRDKQQVKDALIKLKIFFAS